MYSSVAVFFLGDPTNHGSNVGAVAVFAMGIFVLIGLLVFLITRRGRRPLHPPPSRARPMPAPRGRPDEEPDEQEQLQDQLQDRFQQHGAATDSTEATAQPQ